MKKDIYIGYFKYKQSSTLGTPRKFYNKGFQVFLGAYNAGFPGQRWGSILGIPSTESVLYHEFQLLREVASQKGVPSLEGVLHWGFQVYTWFYNRVQSQF